MDAVFMIILIAIGMWILFSVINAICDDDYSSSSSLSSSSSKNESRSSKPFGSYINTDIYGVPNSTTYIDDEDDIVTHVIDGDIKSSTSFDINDHEKIHFGLDGSYLGSTKQKEDGKIERYGSDKLYDGHSIDNGDGTIDHYDKWGLYIGSSKK